LQRAANARTAAGKRSKKCAAIVDNYRLNASMSKTKKTKKKHTTALTKNGTVQTCRSRRRRRRSTGPQGFGRWVAGPVGQAQDAEVPVGAARGDGGALLDEVGGAGRVPEPNGAGREVDLEGEVVPDVDGPGDAQFALAADGPLQVLAGGAVDPAELELGEARLKKQTWRS
jgi:hypothetical protein